MLYWLKVQLQMHGRVSFSRAGEFFKKSPLLAGQIRVHRTAVSIHRYIQSVRLSRLRHISGVPYLVCTKVDSCTRRLSAVFPTGIPLHFRCETEVPSQWLLLKVILWRLLPPTGLSLFRLQAHRWLPLQMFRLLSQPWLTVLWGARRLAPARVDQLSK